MNYFYKYIEVYIMYIGMEFGEMFLFLIGKGLQKSQGK